MLRFLTAGESHGQALVVVLEGLPAGLPLTVDELQPGAGERLRVVDADALTVGPEQVGAPTALVANLPYNVSVPVLLHLLATVPSLRGGLVMVQSEVADRLVAPPGSRTYGVPSAKLAWYGPAARSGSVPPSVFWPEPRVDSGLVGFERGAPRGDEALRERTFAVIDAAFAGKLAALADVYVNDAFGAAHRAHASVEAIVRLVKDAGAGLLMDTELRYLGEAVGNPQRPYVAILGGAKVSDKIEVIDNLIPKVDRLIIGGAMAYTFFKAQGKPVGTSLVEDDKLDAARDIVSRAAKSGLQLLLPVDHVVAEKLAADVPTTVLSVDDAAIGDRMGLDIGPATAKAYTAALADAKTVVWNGPMGVFEIDAFAQGTLAVANAVAAVNGTTVVGGGDSIAAVHKCGIADRITHISTGGGASLELLEGRELPGVAALPDRT